MNRFITRKAAVIAALVVGIGAAVGGGTALAAGGDDDATETPIVGSALEQAEAAALAHTGQGKVTGTEVGDEESYYEVEVTLDNGSQVDVQLDKSFNVVGSEGDRDGSGED
jgi:Peptidase propeptide and YPEB domain